MGLKFSSLFSILYLVSAEGKSQQWGRGIKRELPGGDVQKHTIYPHSTPTEASGNVTLIFKRNKQASAEYIYSVHAVYCVLHAWTQTQ